MTRVGGGGGDDNSFADGAPFVMRLCGLGMIAPSSVTAHVGCKVNWFAKLCAEMIHDVSDTHDLDSPV